MKFKEWFENNLTVGGFPFKVNHNFNPSDYDIVINVSDEFYIDYENQINEVFVKNYWFPMNECKKDIGLNSIYAALVILHRAELRNLRVYLHCHAGCNRSRIVQAAYYFMRTNSHLEIDKNIGFINMMVASCARGYLPPKAEMERFLGKVASNINNMQGGILDLCKLESIHNF